MSNRRNRAGVLGLFVLVLAAGCATGPTTSQSVGTGQNTVSVEAGSYYFKPNLLQVAAPGPLTLQVRNVADIQHNITVKNPAGEVIGSQDLPPGQTTSLTVDLKEAGTYNMYCNKPFHATLGMKGTIQVGQ